jgi:hypothetical protein
MTEESIFNGFSGAGPSPESAWLDPAADPAGSSNYGPWESRGLFPYADVFAFTHFLRKQDHANGHVYVSGLIGNRGTMSTLFPVRVVLGVDFRGPEIEGQNMQRIETIASGLRPGDFMRTTPLRAPLYYYDETRASYIFELQILEFSLNAFVNTSPTNDYAWRKWRAYSPRILASEDSFEFGNMDESIQIADKT